MPELPEVEYYKGVIDQSCIGKRIKKAQVLVPYLLQGTTGNGFARLFTGAKLTETYRKGKFLFARSDKGVWLSLHFGLTGDLIFSREKEIPRFAAFYFEFDKGMLVFTDMRKFGRFGVIEDPHDFLSTRKWGPDALEISKEEFIGGIGKRKVAIKTLLMDQKFIAGIGNEYSDEILYRARLHPEKLANSIKPEMQKELFKISRAVLKQAIKLEAEREKMKKKLFFVANRKAGLECPNCGGPTSSLTVGGRTAYFCPKCQKK